MSLSSVNLKRKREEFEKDAIELLTCPICFEHLTAPSYECRKGHMLCIECYKSIMKTSKICPQCRCDLKTGVLENHFISQMISYFSCECSYKRNGCNIELNLATRKNHEEHCHYNPSACSNIEIIRCPCFEYQSSISVCNLEVNKDDIIKHFKEFHPDVQLRLGSAYYFAIYDPYDFRELIELPIGYIFISVRNHIPYIVDITPIWINQKYVDGKLIMISCLYSVNNLSERKFQHLKRYEEPGCKMCTFIFHKFGPRDDDCTRKLWFHIAVCQ